jgi:hypothetical protein
MADTLYVSIVQRENDPDAPAASTTTAVVEKLDGWEEALLLKIAHALGKDSATSVTLNED